MYSDRLMMEATAVIKGEGKEEDGDKQGEGKKADERGAADNKPSERRPEPNTTVWLISR